MAHHKQAEKRNRQGQRRALRNKSVRTGVRTAVKKLQQALATAKPEEVKGLLQEAIRKLDKAHGKGVLTRRASARRISQVTRAANAAKAKP
ncbi:MAG: 30S ribosomal protein S20 [Deltaproteobacteria bacterium]|nr:30S ribosomal protein S20 [Deltaproteobacteria bacterium]